MHFVNAKGILSAKNGMNVYRGCTHGCIYCDSRSACYQMPHAFEDIEVKQNAPQLLEEALRGKRRRCMIGTGAMCDPYMHCEQQLRLTRRCLEIIDRYGFGVCVQTKSDRILRDLELYQNRTMENALTDLLPRSMIPVVLDRLEIDPAMQANSLTKEKRRALVGLLKAFRVEITGKRPVAEAIITSGGVKVSEIDPKTMESKLVPGLYFAGEVIDCDAYTGGFNLQIAWATAFAAGRSAAGKKKH